MINLFLFFIKFRGGKMPELSMFHVKKYLYEMITKANKLSTIIDRLDEDVSSYQLDPKEVEVFNELSQSIKDFVETSRNVLR